MPQKYMSREEMQRELAALKQRNRELESQPKQAPAAPGKSHAIDVNMVNPFLEGVMSVLRTMCQVDAKPGKPFVKKEQIAKGDVTGIISVDNESTRGTISVSFPELLARTAIGQMIGEDIDELNDDVYDGVGELTNQISGQARQGLAKRDMSLKAGIPSVVMGKNHEIKHLAKAPILAIPFTTLYGQLLVEVCFEHRNNDD